MDWTLEVVVVPVSDIDRAIAFYRDQVGFELDHDTRIGEQRVAQLTPTGSGCSIVVGDLPGMTEMTPGSLKGVQLVVADAETARQQLVDHGVEPTEINVIDPRDGGTMFWFSDPDGNAWTVQQYKVRADKPLIPRTSTTEGCQSDRVRHIGTLWSLSDRRHFDVAAEDAAEGGHHLAERGVGR